MNKEYIDELFEEMDYKVAYDKVRMEIYSLLCSGEMSYLESRELIGYINEKYDAICWGRQG